MALAPLRLVGDGEGSVGCGLGKALEISESAKKAVAIATKDMKSYSYFKTTIPHEVVGYFCSAKVLLKPAAPGSGIIANGSSRMVMEAIGVKDINIKTLGSRNPHNVVKATIHGLSQLRSFDSTAKLRGKDIKDVCLVNY